MKKTLSYLLSLSLFFSCTSAPITKEDRSKACPLGAKALVLAGSMAAVTTAALSLEAGVRFESPKIVALGFSLCVPVGMITASLLSRYKVTPFPLNKKQVALASLITGLISGAITYRVAPAVFMESRELRDVDAKNALRLKTVPAAGILTALITGYILNEYTPESVHYEASTSLQEHLGRELFNQSFDSNESFFDYVKNAYTEHGWPLALAYDAISDNRYEIFSLGHVLKVVHDVCKKDGGYDELRASCLEQQKQIEKFDELSRDMLALIKNHPDFPHQVKLQQEYAIRRAKEIEERIQKARELNENLHTANSVVDLAHNVLDLVKDNRREQRRR